VDFGRSPSFLVGVNVIFCSIINLTSFTLCDCSGRWTTSASRPPSTIIIRVFLLLIFVLFVLIILNLFVFWSRGRGLLYWRDFA
jgi:hypothetical protein